MLNDAFKLTLDVLYPPLKGFTAPKQADDPGSTVNDPLQDIASPLQEKFSVDGYPDEVNMWGDSFY
jgi:hypothetical protein